ncbi:MAG: enoyl-CoA hydratase/isomerase family protein [Litoreibacter sp.]|nr:enoyl-CoA hydratase/isomerase family protein [Litoreibacter sp.]
MGEDIHIRQQGRVGRITLQRPDALNALTYDMVRAIEEALDAWRDADIDLILLDAEGPRAFCAGGDIADLYESGVAGNFAYSQQFWRDEYRLNAKLSEFPKPVVSFLQGFTMGGGVGLGCHGSHRIVDDSSRIALPECGIGLVPDVGGSLILAHAQGHLGEYLSLTSTRIGPADAIFVGFADHYVPADVWEHLKDGLCEGGDAALIEATARPAPEGVLAGAQAEIDQLFAADTVEEIYRALGQSDSTLAQKAHKAMTRNAPLAMAFSMEIIRSLRNAESIRDALDLEYRYTFRAMEQGDFIEGIRAAIIDKDQSPKWKHESPHDVTDQDLSAMLAPLGRNALNWENTL